MTDNPRAALRRVIEAAKVGEPITAEEIHDAIGHEMIQHVMSDDTGRWTRPALTPEMIEKALSGESLGPALDSLMRSEDYQRAYRQMILTSPHNVYIPLDATSEQQEAFRWMGHPLHQRAVHAQVVEMARLRGLHRPSLKVLVPRWWPESVDGGTVQGMPIQRSHLVTHLSVVPR